MARHYPARDFFRQMPNALRAPLFRGLGPLVGLDLSALTPDALFPAWFGLPDDERNLPSA